MIEVRNLSKNYGQIEAIKGLSFVIKGGSSVALLGPNGAGKSTTMRILTTLLRPSSGEVRVAGFDVMKDPDFVRRNIGFLPETPPIYPELTVLEYLRFVAKIKQISRKNQKAAIEEIVERCALAGVRKRLCGQLSKGYRQRLGIAQAVIHKPAVLVLDEPTSGLDPAQIQETRALVKSLGAQSTILLSTHVLSEAASMCSSAVIIAGGKLVREVSIDELTTDSSFEDEYLRAVGGS